METKEINAVIGRKPMNKQRHPKHVSFRRRSNSNEKEASRDKPNRRKLVKTKNQIQISETKVSMQECRRCCSRCTNTMKVHINGQPARLQLDTGADITMISRKTWNKIGLLP
ncbi:hypothetical protein OSTOST_21850 [Ostertagia ostertagi]